jgi:hypothetical protein
MMAGRGFGNSSHKTRQTAGYRTSFVATKQHFFQNRDYKKFHYAEVEMQNIVGPTAVAIGVAGIRGGYQKIGEKDISAILGQIYPDSEYSSSGNEFAGSGAQTRIVRTTEFPPPSECNEECVESDIKGIIDKAFSLVVVWSGIAGISAYRIFAQSYPQSYQGICEANETGEERLVTDGGCGVFGLFSTQEPFEKFYATGSYSLTVNQNIVIDGVTYFIPGVETIFTSTQDSVISQVDADRKALASARFKANVTIGA